MSAPPIDNSSGDSSLDSVEPSRWGLRLRELAAEASSPIVEPVVSQPTPSFWQRVRRGVAVPVSAAAAVFIAIVLISVTSVWLRPHGVNDVTTSDATGAVTDAYGSPIESEAGWQFAKPGTEGGIDFGTKENRSEGGGTGVTSGRSELLFVHVVGEVHRPGVYELKPGARALAAIEAAGGATAGAVLSALNLARPLTDGEQLLVPNAEGAMSALVDGQVGPSLTGAGVGTGLISLNSAGLAALETLPRVGPAMAQRIIDWRTEHGGFQSVDQLLNVSGIGQKTFEQLRDLVTL